MVELEVVIPDKSANMASWRDIDSILVGPEFPFLREVGVGLSFRGWTGISGHQWDKLRADVVRGFPLLRGRGVLVKPY